MIKIVNSEIKLQRKSRRSDDFVNSSESYLNVKTFSIKAKCRLDFTLQLCNISLNLPVTSAYALENFEIYKLRYKGVNVFWSYVRLE